MVVAAAAIIDGIFDVDSIDVDGCTAVISLSCATEDTGLVVIWVVG